MFVRDLPRCRATPEPVPPRDLEDKEIERILDLSDQHHGYSGTIGTNVDNAFGSNSEQWSGN